MDYAELDKALSAWLTGYGYSSKRTYRRGMWLFLKFLNGTQGEGWTVDKIIEKRLVDLQERHFWFEQKAVEFFVWLKDYVSEPGAVHVERHQYGKVVPYDQPVKGGKKPADNHRSTLLTGVRSFFAFHRLDLKFTRQQKLIIGKEPELVYADYEFDISDLKAMAEVAKPQERYILLAGKDLGLRAIDFASLKQGLFINAIGKEPPVFLGKIFTKKEAAYAHPFLTADGLNAAKTWLRVLQSKGRHDDAKPMIDIDKKELTENLKRLAQRAGVDTHGTRIRFHCLRKFLSDRISLQMSESKWKQIVGKKINESAYVSSLNLREAFKRVMNLIQITGSELPQLSPDETTTLREMIDLMKKGKIQLKI